MKNVLKITGVVVVAIIFSLGLNANLKKESGAIDLTALNSANAWHFCVDWFPEGVGQPIWNEVSDRFPQSEINRIDAEYPQFTIIASNRQFCMLGGTDICYNLDIAVSQTEWALATFADYNSDNPL